ncbi:MAG: hypothetical protein EZS28_032711 [Streblomastix strix]|uniref:Uncharacterized protein n=1 Tax=Streblomastix strix TaxID=222440 RepID=A0A5J4UNW2_9EUKA|nr:MAG: hypothetical protein EZS28_032711 [Streblomastix strix]
MLEPKEQSDLEEESTAQIVFDPSFKGIAPGKYDDSNPEAAWTSINQTNRNAIHLFPQSVEPNLVQT